jgi:hypothetical protein
MGSLTFLFRILLMLQVIDSFIALIFSDAVI